MDRRLLDILAAQQPRQFADLAGSETQSTIRVSEQLLNQVIATYLPKGGAVRDVRVQPHAGNRLDVTVTMARPGFLPPMRFAVEIERQPDLPSAPTLVLRLSDLADMMRFAAPTLADARTSPPGVRLDGDHVFLDLAALARERGLDGLLAYAQQLRIGTEEAGVAIFVAARLP